MARSLDLLLALHSGAEEGLASIGDPCSLCWQQESSRGRERLSALFALLLHGMLFLIVIPTAARQLTDNQTLVLARLAPPLSEAAAAGTLSTEGPKAAAPSIATTQEPIPMPLLETPRPAVRSNRLDAPEIQPMEWQGLELRIGEIAGPPAAGPGQSGERGSLSGLGPAGEGEAYRAGVGGVSRPKLLVQTLPSYTDSAIKARVQGTVLLRAVVRRDGSVDSIQVLRGLGHGLDEKAIEEIANHWKFRPGLRNGQPVDVSATIEVSFSLR